MTQTITMAAENSIAAGLLCLAEARALVVDELTSAAIKLYQRAGFKLLGMYDTVFLQRPSLF